MSIPRLIASAVLALLCLTPVVWFVGAANPVTPAGYVGYLTKGAVFGKSRFYGVQRGPTSPGRTWLVRVTNVSVTPYTYTEDFIGDEAVLSRDNLKISFKVHTVWRIDEAKVPLFMDRYSTTRYEFHDDSRSRCGGQGCLRQFRPRAVEDDGTR